MREAAQHIVAGRAGRSDADPMLAVQVPAGHGPGMQFLAQAPDGSQFSVVVPPGVVPGQNIQVQLPLAAATMSTAMLVSQDAVDVNVSTMQAAGTDAVDEGKITLVHACCCSHVGVYCADNCCGCAQKWSCLCLTFETCCKPNTPCLCCGCCGLRLTDCVLIKRQAQLCCLVEQCAFPCDDEVPCACAWCGLACYPKCGFCSTLEDLTGVRQTIYRSRVVGEAVIVTPGSQAAPPPPSVMIGR